MSGATTPPLCHREGGPLRRWGGVGWSGGEQTAALERVRNGSGKTRAVGKLVNATNNEYGGCHRRDRNDHCSPERSGTSNTERCVARPLHCLAQPRSHGVRAHPPSLSGHWSAMTYRDILDASIISSRYFIEFHQSHAPPAGRCLPLCAPSPVVTTPLSPTTGAGGRVILSRCGSGRTSDPRSSVPVFSPPPRYTPLDGAARRQAHSFVCLAPSKSHVHASPHGSCSVGTRRQLLCRCHGRAVASPSPTSPPPPLQYRHRRHLPCRRRRPCCCVKLG